MPSKKKAKGVLERIGDVATSAAEVVINAGSKAVHAVGDMMPTGTPQKGAKTSSKASKVKTSQATAKTSKAPPKAMAKASKPEKVAAKKKTAGPSAMKAALRKALPTKSAKPSPSPKPKRQAGTKG